MFFLYKKLCSFYIKDDALLIWKVFIVYGVNILYFSYIKNHFSSYIKRYIFGIYKYIFYL